MNKKFEVLGDYSDSMGEGEGPDEVVVETFEDLFSALYYAYTLQSSADELMEAFGGVPEGLKLMDENIHKYQAYPVYLIREVTTKIWCLKPGTHFGEIMEEMKKDDELWTEEENEAKEAESLFEAKDHSWQPR